MIIVIAGNIQHPEEIKKLIADYFSPLSPTKTIEKPLFPNQLPCEHTAFFEKETEQNHLIIAAPGILESDERKRPAKLLMTIL